MIPPRCNCDDPMASLVCVVHGIIGKQRYEELEKRTNLLPSAAINGSMPEFFTMAIEPHDPTNLARPCPECVLSKGPFMCMDRSYCTVKETGKTWKKKA